MGCQTVPQNVPERVKRTVWPSDHYKTENSVKTEKIETPAPICQTFLFYTWEKGYKYTQQTHAHNEVLKSVLANQLFQTLRVQHSDVYTPQIQMEDALLILVSDHGQADIERTVNLREAMDRLMPGIPLQPQSNGMSAYFFPKEEVPDPDSLIPQLEEHREALGIARVYSSKDLKRMHTVSGPVLAAEAAEGVVFSDSLDAEKREKATHGFGPGAELGSFPMRDIGPTIAGLMGVELPTARGTDRSGEILE